VYLRLMTSPSVVDFKVLKNILMAIGMFAG
jgi:hypothetical protein